MPRPGWKNETREPQRAKRGGKMKAWKSLPLILVGLCLIVGNATAASGPPTDTVRKMLGDLKAIQNDPGLQGREKMAARKERIRKAIIENFDSDRMAQAALGQYCRQLSKEEQDEFKVAFRELFLDSYANMVLNFLKNETIDYGGEFEDRDQVTVRTTVRSGDQDIPVDYCLAKAGERYVVRDVTAEGVSMVDNYQKTFSRVIKQEGYEGLIRRMKLQQQAARPG
jgi:phospholipid transport system substrate-binding protein